MNEIFQKLDCSDTQAKIYEHLLQIGPSLASMIAKRTGFKRVTVYGALEGLVQKGLVETYKKNHISYYQACDPELISNLLEMKLEEEKMFNDRARKKIKEFKKTKEKSGEQIIEVKGVIKYYEGKEAVKTLNQENLNLLSKTQFCIGMSGYHSLKIAGEWKKYIESRVKKGMKVYSIQANNKQGRAYKKRDSLELRETRLIPKGKMPDFGELNIIGDRIILFTSEKNEEMGVKIINKKIASILKRLFKLAWEQSKTLEEKNKTDK